MQPAEHFSLYRVFSSHMVLQRERPICFSGKADTGKSVTVVFAGETRIAIAGTDGEWSTEFPAMEAGGAYDLMICGAPGREPIICSDILIGEVWLCSGQSNMAMRVCEVMNSDTELKEADYPEIRLYNVIEGINRLAPEEPLKDELGDGWKCCSAESVANFSACGYFFGRQLYKELHIPIGLISAAWGGTGIESWISPEKFKECRWKFPAPADWNTAWEKLVANDPDLWAWLEKFELCGKVDPAWLNRDFDDSGWELCRDKRTVLPKPGRYLCRMTFDVPAELAESAFAISPGSVSDVDKSYLNGTKIGETTIRTPKYWDCERKYEIPSDVLRAGRNCLAVIADNHFSSGEVPSAEITLVTPNGNVILNAECRIKNIFLLPPDFPERPVLAQPSEYPDKSTPNYPSTLSNGMLAPWFRYAIRGTIWYQGCHNNGEFSYYLLHKMLIDDFREHWNDPEMPFLLVQLAAFHQHTPTAPLSPEDADTLPITEYPPYAVTREIQAEMPYACSSVGMVTAFDRGEISEIHPHDKQTVGWRLAKKALHMVYGVQGVCDGPEFAGMSLAGNTLRIFFCNTGSGLTTSDGKSPVGFIVSDRTGHFFKAKARIEDSCVVLENLPFVPQRVRYAFTGYCRVNLMNKEGFPALPFRSDKPDYKAVYFCKD